MTTINHTPIQPRIETLKGKQLIGISVQTSLANDQTYRLWQSFMPRRKEITNSIHTDLFSIQIFPFSFDFTFSDLNTSFTKWAAVEVEHTNHIPIGMSELKIPDGLYAVFNYKGLNTDPSIFIYIFSEWLPKSIYQLDNRPHFELLGERYKNNDPNSEEEIWIPVKLRNN